MNLDKALYKQKLLQVFVNNKNDTLNLTPKDIKKKFSFGNKILKFFWKTKFTKFDISDYVKVSKKQRTNISEKKIKDVLQYSFLGYCYNFKKNAKSINASFSIRNVLDGFPVEMIFPVYSPVILSATYARNIYTKKMKRNKLYILRKKAVTESYLEFDYVSRKKTEFVKKRLKTIKKLRV